MKPVNRHLLSLKDEYKNEAGSVIEVDFYNASSLLGLSDEEAVECALRKYLQGSLPEFATAKVQDFKVTRYTVRLFQDKSLLVYLLAGEYGTITYNFCFASLADFSSCNVDTTEPK